MATGESEMRPGRRRGRAGAVVLVLAVLALLGAITVWQALFAQPSPPRNVLLIVADTLRADHLGCYRFEGGTSPRIDRLAGEGILFADFNTVIPATLPSFASLLTSLHPKDHGAARNGFVLDDAPLRLGEVFRSAGFETAAFVASYCISSEFGIAKGFDRFDEEFSTDTGLPHNKLIRGAEDVSSAAMRWLEGRDRDRRFFAMVHYFDPHWPYDQPEPFRTRFTPRGVDPALGSIRNVLDMREHLKASGAPNLLCQDLHSLYCGAIAYMDREIGRLLDALEDQGYGQDTLVVFTADHGETFWEHRDFFDHGLFVYDTNVRIPLIMRWPDRAGAGTRIEAPVSNLDLGPTLLDLAGLDVPEEFAGRSFARLERGGGREGAELLFAEACKPYDVEEGAARTNLNKARSVRSGSWKFIRVPYLQDQRELYNLERDPMETTNLIRNPAFRETAAALDAALEQWAHSFQAAGEAPPLDPGVQEKLEALGYGR